MAAAIIPIIAAAEPILAPLIHRLVLFVESKFGPKTGPTKFSTVVAAIGPVANALATAGLIPGTLDGVSIAALVQSVVQSLQSTGILNPATAAVINAQPIGVGTGSPSTIRVIGGTLQLQFG